MAVRIVLGLIALINLFFLVSFLRDLSKNRSEMRTEPGNPVVLELWSAFVFFFSTFGISDFALSTIFYRKMKLIDDKKLPGHLILSVLYQLPSWRLPTSQTSVWM